MALYSYVKTNFSLKSRLVSAVSVICILAGVGLLSWVLFPIISFELFYAPALGSLIKPIPNAISNSGIENFYQVWAAETADYTKASVWFPKAFNMKIVPSVNSYLLSIPKLGINNASVVVGAEDLSKSLIHFTGALPGEYGNPVIFGHSTLLWFYSPKDYKSIFSKLPDLKNGDEIITIIDNITYRYKIYEMKIVSPDNTAVLEQRFDQPYITLVTCVPPGTYLKRLIVRGKLVNI